MVFRELNLRVLMGCGTFLDILTSRMVVIKQICPATQADSRGLPLNSSLAPPAHRQCGVESLTSPACLISLPKGLDYMEYLVLFAIIAGVIYKGSEIKDPATLVQKCFDGSRYA